MTITPLDLYKHCCKRDYEVHDPSYIDIVLAAIFALELDMDPVWLFLAGRPSIGKGTLLEPLSVLRDRIYMTDCITDKTLISGRRGKDGEDPSLLPKLDHKTLVLTDFSLLFSKHRDVLPAIMGQLRKVYDGKLSQNYSGIYRSYKVKMGFVAACTTTLDDHLAAISELGERYLICRMPDLSAAAEIEGCKKALSEESKTKADARMERLIAAVFKDAPNENPSFPEDRKAEIENKIMRYARFISYCRWACPVNPYTKEPHTTAREAPFRLAKQLKALSIGIAAVNQHAEVGSYEMRLLRKVARDSMTLRRRTLLTALNEAWPDSVTTTEIAKMLRMTSETARNAMYELRRVDVVEAPQKKGKGQYEPYAWKLTPTLHDVIEGIL